LDDSLFSRDIAAAQAIATPASPNQPDTALSEVYRKLKSLPELEYRLGQSLRQSIDEVLDGQRTGRFNIKDLEKTEKTYLGTKVEIIIRAEFDLGRGKKMDFSIDGHDVDSKFTSGTNWTIPREADGHICLLTQADDHTATYRAGLIRIHRDFLNTGENRDGKRTLSAVGRRGITWLIPEGKLPENILLSLPRADMEEIFKNGKSGQSRTNELFLRVQGKLVNRNTVLTVARQDDSPKRVRDARRQLRIHGVIILGHQGQHPRIARELELPVPDKGSWLAVRISEISNAQTVRKTTEISGLRYTVWKEGDLPSVAPETY
jgi:hypothetical protein